MLQWIDRCKKLVSALEAGTAQLTLEDGYGDC